MPPGGPVVALASRIPDEFFKATSDDLRRHLAHLKSERAEAPGRSPLSDQVLQGGSDERKTGTLPKSGRVP